MMKKKTLLKHVKQRQSVVNSSGSLTDLIQIKSDKTLTAL